MKYRVLEISTTKKFLVQEQRACGDYDGWEWRWCNCSRVHKKVFNFLGMKLKYNTYPKASFTRKEDAVEFMEKLIYKDSLVHKDKVVVESV